MPRTLPLQENRKAMWAIRVGVGLLENLKGLVPPENVGVIQSILGQLQACANRIEVHETILDHPFVLEALFPNLNTCRVCKREGESEESLRRLSASENLHEVECPLKDLGDDPLVLSAKKFATQTPSPLRANLREKAASFAKKPSLEDNDQPTHAKDWTASVDFAVKAAEAIPSLPEPRLAPCADGSVHTIWYRDGVRLSIERRYPDVFYALAKSNQFEDEFCTSSEQAIDLLRKHFA